MDMNYLIVVGDKFSGFARNENIVKQSQLDVELKQRTHQPTSLIAGQGLTRETIEEIDRLIARFPRTQWLEAEGTGLETAPERLCHKSRAENRLVSLPTRLSERHMQMDLLVHNDNELMLDHITGQHIQGMVLIEAARQSFLTVTEQFHAKKDQQYYFVINRMDTRFHSFVFPLGATIDYQIHSLRASKRGTISSAATINFHQCNDTPATTCEVEFTAYPAEFLAGKEQNLAANMVTRFVSEFAEEGSQLSA
ncbi:AfsA-related hotdog domain-containing protein [Marinobacter sp. DUT-3]|uniref:AfsA-related hotdog domain-containing protein n=1 Tax=unclassified Marinobacter TaxID=83889 RepID=UPI00387AB542